MKSSKRWDLASLLAFTIVLLLALGSIYGGVLGQNSFLFPPVDGTPLHPGGFQDYVRSGFSGRWSGDALGMGLGAQPLATNSIFFALVPPLVAHVAQYVFGSILMAVSVLLFLRQRGLAPMPACTASLSAALSGYMITLVSAGHAGMFAMMPMAVLSLAFLDVGIDRRSALSFALAGACAGLGFASQPDVMGLFGVLLGAYSLFRFMSLWWREPTARISRLKTVVFGVVLASAAFACVAVSGAGWLARRVEHRQGTQGKTAAEKWEFATNWSMPPEEILEFVAPCVFGVETRDPAGPYWGRLGRTKGWPQRQGLMNLKQHTLYMGVLQFLFAAFAIGLVFARRPGKEAVAVKRSRAERRCKKHDGAGDEVVTAPSESAVVPGRRGEIIFWSVAFIVTVLLALGRYFPLYRLFYSLPLPFVSSIRAPVKFIHLSEVALCILFAFGLERFFALLKPGGRRPGRALVGFGLTAAALGLVLLVAAGTLSGGHDGLLSYWTRLGLQQHTSVMLAVMTGALARGGLLFLCGGGVFLLAWKVRKPWLGGVLGIALLALVAVDMATVAKRYVRTGDVRPWYRPNPVAAGILSATATEPARTAFLITPKNRRIWPYGSLMHHGIDMPLPMQRESLPDPEYLEYLGALGFNMLQPWPLPPPARLVRLWELTNTRHVIGTQEQLAPLAETGVLALVQRFAIDGRKGHEQYVLTPNPSAPFGVYRLAKALPRAAIYYAWETVPDEVGGARSRLTDPAWDPRASVLVGAPLSASSTNGVGAVTIETYRRTKVVLSVDAAHQGVVLFNDKYDPEWTVKLNGKRVPLLRCNGIMRGVEVPRGIHSITMTYRPALGSFLLSVVVLGVLTLWTLFAAVLRLTGRKREGSDA